MENEEERKKGRKKRGKKEEGKRKTQKRLHVLTLRRESSSQEIDKTQ